MEQLSLRLMNWASILEDGAIMPAAVGVDIGCGMNAVRTQWHVDELPQDRRALREAIEGPIPLSAGAANQHVDREHTRERLARLEEKAAKAGFDPTSYAGRWKVQLGTL